MATVIPITVKMSGVTYTEESSPTPLPPFQQLIVVWAGNYPNRVLNPGKINSSDAPGDCTTMLHVTVALCPDNTACLQNCGVKVVDLANESAKFSKT